MQITHCDITFLMLFGHVLFSAVFYIDCFLLSLQMFNIESYEIYEVSLQFTISA